MVEHRELRSQHSFVVEKTCFSILRMGFLLILSRNENHVSSCAEINLTEGPYVSVPVRRQQGDRRICQEENGVCRMKEMK